MNWRDFYGFEGRLSRVRYCHQMLTLQFAAVIIWCAGLFAIMAVGRTGAVLFAGFTPLACGFLSLGVRRLHDCDMRGRWVWVFALGPWAMMVGAYPFLISQVPNQALIGLGICVLSFLLSTWGFVVLYFRRGTRGENRWGEPSADLLDRLDGSAHPAD